MTVFVQGFYFDQSCERVVLVRKENELRSVRAYVTQDDRNYIDALRRKFRDTTNALVTRWFPFAKVHGSHDVTYCYYGVALTPELRIDAVESREPAEVVQVADLARRADIEGETAWLTLAARDNYWSEEAADRIEVFHGEVVEA